VIGQALEGVQEHLMREVDIQEIVRVKVERLSGERVEEMLLSIMRSQFLFLEIVSAVLGFVIGLAQVGLGFI
jgi:uncharacterized membrane protein YheB (UPF0754 family)